MHGRERRRKETKANARLPCTLQAPLHILGPCEYVLHAVKCLGFLYCGEETPDATLGNKTSFLSFNIVMKIFVSCFLGQVLQTLVVLSPSQLTNLYETES